MAYQSTRERENCSALVTLGVLRVCFHFEQHGNAKGKYSFTTGGWCLAGKGAIKCESLIECLTHITLQNKVPFKTYFCAYKENRIRLKGWPE